MLNFIAILAIYKDWAYFVLRVAFGLFLLSKGVINKTKGRDKALREKGEAFLNFWSGFFLLGGALVNILGGILSLYFLFLIFEAIKKKKIYPDFFRYLTYLAVSLYFFAAGAGIWSIDRILLI